MYTACGAIITETSYLAPINAYITVTCIQRDVFFIRFWFRRTDRLFNFLAVFLFK